MLLVALDPSVPLDLLDLEVLLAKMVLLVTQVALDQREKLETLDTMELQAKMDLTVPLVLLGLLDLVGLLVPRAIMVLPVRMEPMA